MATSISYFIVEINSGKLIRLYGEKIIPIKIVKEINKIENDRNRQNFIFFRYKNNRLKKIGVTKIKDESLVARPIPETIEAKIKYLIFKLSKILKDNKILEAKTNNKIDSVVPKCDS